MPQLVMSRRDFAGVQVAMTTAFVPPSESAPLRRIVALGWLSRNGGQVIVSAQLNAPASAAAEQ